MFRISNKARESRIKIDLKDKKILQILSENARIPISELAKKVRLSRDTANYKIKRLEKLGAILKFFPEVDFKKLGYNLFKVFILLDETNKERQKELIARLKDHPHTLSLMEYSDRWDLELFLIAKDLEEFSSIVSEISAEFSDIILEKSKMAVIDTYYSLLFPYHFYKEVTQIKFTKKKEKQEYKPDEKDIKILHVLSTNCRLSTYEISKEVKLSADAVGLRIKKLLNSGIIKKFTILPNLSLLGYNWYTFKMRVAVLDKKNEARFKTFISDHPYIIKAVKVLGMCDLLLYIISDGQEYFHKTVKQIKKEFSDIIRDYGTFVAYREHMFRAMPNVL